MLNTVSATDHSYYCEDSNYYQSGVAGHFDSWKEFKENWLDITFDDDYNHCFRFDINEQEDDDDGSLKGVFDLHLYFMLQRKGAFIPVLVKNIKEEDLPEINEFLAARWDYLKKQWAEFSGAEQ